jgi:hypothetical protein
LYFSLSSPSESVHNTLGRFGGAGQDPQ